MWCLFRELQYRGRSLGRDAPQRIATAVHRRKIAARAKKTRVTSGNETAGHTRTIHENPRFLPGYLLAPLSKAKDWFVPMEGDQRMIFRRGFVGSGDRGGSIGNKTHRLLIDANQVRWRARQLVHMVKRDWHSVRRCVLSPLLLLRGRFCSQRSSVCLCSAARVCRDGCGYFPFVDPPKNVSATAALFFVSTKSG